MRSCLEEMATLPVLAIKCGFSVLKLSARCGVCVRQVQRLVARQYGQPPHQWLRTLRLQRAAELLVVGCSVKETTGALDYKSRAHFSRDFKAYFQMPPSRYARRHARRASRRGRV
jgi:AraC-like DNA-binding protein